MPCAHYFAALRGDRRPPGFVAAFAFDGTSAYVGGLLSASSDNLRQLDVSQPRNVIAFPVPALGLLP
jgi:hypothetical protein